MSETSSRRELTLRYENTMNLIEGNMLTRSARACDIHMQLCANAKERTRDDWAELLARANSHFKLSSVVTPPHSALSILEVMWTGAEGLLSGEIS